jgi:hypothetical protein
MIKFSNIIKESFEISYDDIKSYFRVFNALHKSGFKSGEIDSVLKFLTDTLSIDFETSFKISLLFDKNYKSDGEYKFINPEDWVIPSEKNITYEQKVVSEYYNVPPLAFKLVNNKDYQIDDGETFVPLIKYKNLTNVLYINIIDYDSVIEEAARNLRDEIIESGWEYYDNYNILRNFIELNKNDVYYNAEEAAKERYGEYITRSESSREIYKQELIDELGLVDEYLDAKGYIEETLEVINGLKSENQQLTHKMRRVEKEIKIIELEMERLVDVVDYGEDEEEYHSMYTEDIYELEEKLRKLESIYDELYNEMDDNNKSISELEIDSSYYYDIYEKYNNEETFKNIFIYNRAEQLAEDFFRDPMYYLEESGYTIDSAIDEGIIEFDEENALNEILERRGVIEFLDKYKEGKYEGTSSVEYKSKNYGKFILIIKKTSSGVNVFPI